MSIVFPDRTFAQTFPCGTNTSPCNGYCPVDYDNFASDSPAPFFLEKYRELVNVLNNCRDIPDENVCYYTPVYIPVNQYVTISRPYKLSDGIYPRRIKERYYRVQY